MAESTAKATVSMTNSYPLVPPPLETVNITESQPSSSETCHSMGFQVGITWRYPSMGGP